MNIKIKKTIFLYKNYKLKCCIGKSGIKKNRKEGDLSTPKGIFRLGPIYYRKDRINLPKCKIKKIVIKKNMGWCDDSKSKSYNRQIKLPSKFGAERLYRKDNIYDIFVNIKYNYNPTRKKGGSAIFLHISNKKNKTTLGCISLSEKDLLKILPTINKKTKILIN